ncbi:class I SAM-dependent methyltransferase [Paenibacillus sp. B2(2019)]|uniref:class I SAM-dependent methyltransferase n=1 Tax=Paenibacillus sp. B2(2019) TaxID=2607754 RepID=UPI0011F3C72B|nr:class I SAM-dependent methyltransferase [Paenibacillus sp. B2(2019)]KAA1191458.1 class I SAM-dependent methyltransferase [Paenibacillus sp. B2(2019)]
MNDELGSKEAIKRWDKYAELISTSYGENGDIHREIFLNPALFSLMGSVENKKVLDAGCGEGYLSRMLAKAGASVTGVDYSQNMITIAKSKSPEELKINFHHGNCEDLSFLQNESYDLIVSNMVIHDLSDYEMAIHEMYRLLVDGGTFIFSILHPCFVTPGSGWVKSDTGEKLYWKVDNYFYEGTYNQNFPIDQEEKFLIFHRTLSSYVNTIVRTGFQINEMIEPKPSAEMLEKYPSFEEDFRCSDFLVFKLRK